jgi:glycosyltransferase involved in cell wall biosynthesis
MRKILVLTSYHPSSREPGRAVWSHYTYSALARYCSIRFLSPWPWWTRTAWPLDLLRPPRERWDDLEIEYPAYWSVPGVTALHALGMSASLLRRVAAVRREFPFEAIVSAWAYPDGVAAAFLARNERVPLVTSVLGSDINELVRRPLIAPQIRWGLRNAQRVIAVSHALRHEVVRLGVPPERAIVRHNGVDGTVFTLRDRQAARAALGLDRDRPLIGYVGNLVHEKGPDVLIEAMGALAREPRTAPDLVVIGSGALERTLRERALALGVADRVRFVGRKTHDELPLWFGALDVLCLPSRREGCPNVVLESLASGRPVVASAVGGLPELLGSDNGILVPAERPTELQRALSSALSRAWDAAKLRDTVPSPSWDAVARTYHAAIEDVIQEHARAR